MKNRASVAGFNAIFRRLGIVAYFLGHPIHNMFDCCLIGSHCMFFPQPTLRHTALGSGCIVGCIVHTTTHVCRSTHHL